MNREIKFRAWDTELQKMCDVVRIDLAKPYNDICYELEYEDNGKYPKNTYSVIEDKCHIMQYTGLKDKNGKEIYEGDILDSKTDAQIYVNYNTEWGYYEAIDTQEKEVQEDDDLKFMHVNYGLLSNCLQDGEYEIIGNIYENPELI